MCTGTKNNLKGCAHTKWIDKQRFIHFFCHSGSFADKLTNVILFPILIALLLWLRHLHWMCIESCVCPWNHLVLSESMVWNSFSSSSSFRVPSEKKAWNSSRESFPSSAGGKRGDFSCTPHSFLIHQYQHHGYFCNYILTGGTGCCQSQHHKYNQCNF